MFTMSPGPVAICVFSHHLIVSLLCLMEDGASTEIAIAGNEGIFGIALFMGSEITASRAVAQSARHGSRRRLRC